MRKNIVKLIILFSFIPVIVSGQFTHLGISAGFGTSAKEPGFGGYVIYTINPQIKIVPNFTYFLTHEVTTDYGWNKFTYWAANMDGHYVIMDKEKFMGFGLMGLSYVNVTGEADEVYMGTRQTDKLSRSKLGLNIGAGIQFPLADYFIPFAELKYTLGDKAVFDFVETVEASIAQLTITAGILFKIGEYKPKDEDDW